LGSAAAPDRLPRLIVHPFLLVSYSSLPWRAAAPSAGQVNLSFSKEHIMFRITLRLFVLALVLTFTLAACGGAAAGPSSTAPKTITLNMTEFQFQPAEITANVGQPIKLVMKNNGTVLHDFVSTDAMAEVMAEQSAMHDMAEMETAMHAAVEPGQQSTLEFKATQPGTYTFSCTVPGHKEAGMVGKLIVK
jgi:uncharacterized cupredoxin-like copper-binding protein